MEAKQLKISNKNCCSFNGKTMLKVRYGEDKEYYVGLFKSLNEANEVYKVIEKNPKKVDDYKFKPTLTDEIKEQIMDLFWDRHRKHRSKKKAYDNSDETIAKKVGVSKYTVAKFISQELDEHFRLLNFKINNGMKLK